MCMITIGNKVYRNLEEQVKKNKEDIEELKGAGITLTGEAIANFTNDTATIVKNINEVNENVEYSLSAPIINKINKSLQIPETGAGSTELVGIGPNQAQVNIDIDTNTLKIENNKLSVIDSVTGVIKDYVDQQDLKLQNQITTTSTALQNLNEEVETIKTDTLPTKLDKATTTSGLYAYVRTGSRDNTLPINPLVGSGAIVQRTKTGTIKANTAVDDNDCVNKKQLDDAIAGVSGSDVTKEYVDNGLAGKLDKIENTSDTLKCYVTQSGVNRLLNTSTDVTRQLIVRWDNSGKLHSNNAQAEDEVVNYNQWSTQNETFKEQLETKATLTEANTFTQPQKLSAGGEVNKTLTFASSEDILDGLLVFKKASVTPTTGLFQMTYTAGENEVVEKYRVPMATENKTHYLITSTAINNGNGLNYDRNTNSLTVGHKITFASGMNVTYIKADNSSETITTTVSTPVTDVVAYRITSAAAGLRLTGCLYNITDGIFNYNQSNLGTITDKEYIPLTDTIYS